MANAQSKTQQKARPGTVACSQQAEVGGCWLQRHVAPIEASSPDQPGIHTPWDYAYGELANPGPATGTILGEEPTTVNKKEFEAFR